MRNKCERSSDCRSRPSVLNGDSEQSTSRWHTRRLIRRRLSRRCVTARATSAHNVWLFKLCTKKTQKGKKRDKRDAGRAAPALLVDAIQPQSSQTTFAESTQEIKSTERTDGQFGTTRPPKIRLLVWRVSTQWAVLDPCGLRVDAPHAARPLLRQTARGLQRVDHGV